jgi:superfamily II DNA or RNA helicase
MSQGSLFSAPERTAKRSTTMSSFDNSEADDAGLRYYQREAVQAAHETLRSKNSALLVMATGTGKTQVFCTSAMEEPGRTLVLCHRRELVKQAAQRLVQMGADPAEVSIEMADEYGDKRAKYVCASVQTITQEKRLNSWRPDHFKLVVFDETHRILAPTWARVVNYFWPGNAKLLGVTATPDRGDGKKLAKFYSEVSYVFDIAEAIEAGYLVPLLGQRAEIESLDLSAISDSGGDLNEAELDEAIANETEGIVREVLKIEPNRCAIWFFPGKLSAELGCRRLNELVPGSAVCVTDDTSPLDRERNLFDFKSGKVKYLCACLVPTEGFDAPRAEMVVIARPTKSRALYAQMCGRATRTVSKAIDVLHGPELAEMRKKAIAASKKPNAVIMDVAGNSGEHSLITPVDILGSNYSEAEVKAAKQIAEKKPGVNISKALEMARDELKRLSSRLSQRGFTSKVSEFDPFKVFDIKSKRQSPYSAYAIPATTRQQSGLVKWGVPEDVVLTLTKTDASKMMTECIRRKEAGLASFNQMATLKKHGVTDAGITKAVAKKALDYLAGTGWGKFGVDVARLDAILHEKRAPGEEG